MACASLLCIAVAGAGRAADSPDVTAQQLNGPTASKKVSAVLWTRRPDRYTLQVVLPNMGRIFQLAGPDRETPAVTLWLLRADGTSVAATREVSREEKNGFRPIEIAYTVPLASGDEAVAAVIRIDDEYFIEPLQSLKGK